MIKKGISIITALLILLSAFMLIPTSASAAPTDDNGGDISLTDETDTITNTDPENDDLSEDISIDAYTADETEAPAEEFTSENIDEPETVPDDDADNNDGDEDLTPTAADSEESSVEIRYDNGKPANGFFLDDGVSYYYRDGVRIEQNWYKSGRSNVIYDRAQWLYTLMYYAGVKIDFNIKNYDATFELAKKQGIISSYTEGDYHASVSRLYAAQTMVKALKYPSRTVGSVRDTNNSDLLTLAYYSYFLPDKNNMLYPYAYVTEEEFDSIISELQLYKALKGKKLTVFGDSIMYGAGNPVGSAWEGIAEMIGRKYGMNYKDYSVPGALMGKADGKSHIADQVRSALSDGRQSDLIILNGGTNDTWHTEVALGSITSGYDMSKIGESNFTNGFEKTMWLISGHWSNVPVIYVRAHKMNLGSQSRQREIGERALNLCEKWRVAGIDLYNQSGFDGTDPSIVARYTDDPVTDGRGIHPIALGYAEFYLSPIGENISHLFSVVRIGDCNADNEINAIDVTYIQQYSAGIPVNTEDETMSNGDVDGNGDTNIIDATYIQKSIAGLDIPYRIGDVIR